MTQTFNKVYQPTRNQVMIEEEYSIPLPAIVSVADNVITFAAAALSNMGITVDMLAGQDIIILDNDNSSSTWAGTKLKVVSNTTNTITVEEVLVATTMTKWPSLPTAAFPYLAHFEPLAVTTRGIRPGAISNLFVNYLHAAGAATDFVTHGVTELFGIIDSGSLPDPKNEIAEMFGIGSDNLPRRHVQVHNKTTYDGSWPISAIIGKRLLSIFGSVAEVANTLTNPQVTDLFDLIPGEQVMHLDAAGAPYAAGAYVQIGVTTAAEIRKIVAKPATTYITLDKPLRKFHAIGTAVSIVDAQCYDAATTAKYITHTLSVAHSVPTYTIGVNKKGETDDVAVENWFLEYTGHSFSDGSFKTSTASELKIDLKSKGLGAKRDAIACPVIDTTLFSVSSVKKKPVHFSRAYVQFDGVKWNMTEEYDLSLTREMDTKHAIAYAEKAVGTEADGLTFGQNPWANFTGRVTFKASFSVPLHNKQLWDIVRARSKVDVVTYFNVPRALTGGTFYEEWTFTVPNVYLEEGPLELPSGASEVQTISGPPDNLTLVVKDKIPYY